MCIRDSKFAMKESVKKSINKNIDFLDIETYYSDAKPKIKLKNNQNFEFLVSLSHENEFANTNVVTENINKK